MVRVMIRFRNRGWKEAFATFIAIGAVAWQILACVESPMSFSPTGDLAFTVMDPYPQSDEGLGNIVLASDHVNRLMVLSKDKLLREIERSDSQLLTAPAYSPDGKEFAYLRLPLLRQADLDRINEFLKWRANSVAELVTGSTADKCILAAPKGSRLAPRQNDSGIVLEDWTDLTLPNFGAAQDMYFDAGGAIIRAELIERSASTDQIVRSFSLRLPCASDKADDPYSLAYLLTRLQYSPDGAWLYFSFCNMSMAINPSTGERRLLAAPDLSTLSPDGKTVVAWMPRDLGSDSSLVFLSTAADRAVTVRLKSSPGFAGVTWIDKNTAGVLGTDAKRFDIYDTEGHLLRSVALPNPGQSDWQEIAVSPNGQYIAISRSDGVEFLTNQGKELAWWRGTEDKEDLVQPTFTPDSRQVAFKLIENAEIGGEKWRGTVAIVFFTPEGQELFRAPIPPA